MSTESRSGGYDRATQPLPHTRDEIGQTCGLCKREIREVFVDSSMPHELHCSEFCAEVRDPDLAEFRTAEVGTYCFYPCPGCGCVMEDEWQGPGEESCSECARNSRDAARVEALRKCLTVFQTGPFAGSIWDGLRAEITAAIGSGQ